MLREHIEQLLEGHGVPRATLGAAGYRLDLLRSGVVLVRWGQNHPFIVAKAWPEGLTRCDEVLSRAGLVTRFRDDGLGLLVEP